MKYPDGREAHVGDRVELWNGNEGVVVCSIDAGEYSDAYPREQWEYLQSGVLILTQQAGLIHYIQPERQMKLLHRERD